MEGDFVPLSEVVELGENYHGFMDELKEDINDLEVPDWILIPKRSSGEHATGNAWLGIVMALTTDDDGRGVIDTRIAIETEERHRVLSNVSEVPSVIREPIAEGIDNVERDVDMCVARMTYHVGSRELEDIELLLLLEEPEETEEETEE